MITTGCDGGEPAFRYLRRCSQDGNIKVHEIAHRLVETVGPDHQGCDFVMAFLNDLAQSPRHLASTLRRGRHPAATLLHA
jgi:ANTAR domain